MDGTRDTTTENEAIEEKYEENCQEDSSSPTEEKSSNSLDKIDILLKATGKTPILKKKRWKVELDKNIGGIQMFLRKYMKLSSSDNLFLYINQSFAPAPDQIIKNLYECYGADGTLVLHYCITQAWG